MAPIAPIGRKKRVSSPTTSLASPPPPAQQPSPAPQSPLHHISDGRITKNAKRALLENLELESLPPYPPANQGAKLTSAVAERTRKLRSHYMLLSHSLKQRVEMRINRVPKKLWKITMGELMQQMDGNASFVGEVRSLRSVLLPRALLMSANLLQSRTNRTTACTKASANH